MRKDVVISLPIPYAIYDVKYTITTLRELDETKALILLAIASNKRTHPTDKLNDLLHTFYHLNNKYDELFASELQTLITNKTIVNEQDNIPSLNSFVGNFKINEKVQKLLDDEDGGFFGNSEDKHTKSLNLRKGIFINQALQEYNPQDQNIRLNTSSLPCLEFVNKNLANNTKYDNAINEYINNNLISSSENLFSHECKNLSDIENGNNLIYLDSDCKFQIDLNDSQATIFAQGKTEQKIYDDYYLPKIFYQDLLQLLCNKVSSKFDNLPIITKLSPAFEFIENESIINLKNCLGVEKDFFSVIDNKLCKLFIFKQPVTDEINSAIWTKLYAQELSINEIKSLLTKNLIANPDFISFIFDKLNLNEITEFILQSICKNNETVKIYQSIIDSNFGKCLSFLISNNIDLELINELFPNQINNYLNEQITTNNEAFLHLLKEKEIVNPALQRIIISKLDKDYSNHRTYLANSNLENNIIQVISQSQQLLTKANELDDNKLPNLYQQLGNQIDLVKQLDTNLNLTTLSQISNDLDKKQKEIKLKLAAVNFDSLTTYAQGNRQILEVDLPKLLGFTYDPVKTANQITDNQIVKQVLNNKQIKQFKELQKYNSTFMHGNEAKDEFSDQRKFDQAFKKLQDYNLFLTDLKNKINGWKNKNKEKEGK